MKVVVFGATGGTGRLLVEKALARGHEVAAFAREPSRFGLEHECLVRLPGDVGDPLPVEQAVAVADAVLSALGPTRSSSRDVMTVGARNIVQAMKKHGVHRLVWQTGAAVQDSQDEASAIRGVMVRLLRFLSPGVLEDAQRAFQLIKASGLDWTVVRVARLKDGPPAGDYRVGFAPPGPRPVSREDVAEFMLRQLSDDSYLCRAPMVGYGGRGRRDLAWQSGGIRNV
jgi:putative NADH-flavin reductase